MSASEAAVIFSTYARLDLWLRRLRLMRWQVDGIEDF